MENMERLEELTTEENEMTNAQLIALLIAIKKIAETSNTQEVIDVINEVLERI